MPHLESPPHRAEVLDPNESPLDALRERLTALRADERRIRQSQERCFATLSSMRTELEVLLDVVEPSRKS